MDAKKRIDRILTAVHERVKEEVGVLLGVEFTLNDAQNTLVSKEAFLDGLVGKQIFAEVDLTGDLEGRGSLVIGIKDGIRLGGTLIMLPDSELEEVVGREEYTGETEDSYGEIANIIAGSYTKIFEESYNKSFRFVRKEQQVIVPAKVDIESDAPFPDGQYYQVSCSMQMEGRQLGELHMLMPAASFDLLPEAVADSPVEPVADSPQDEAVSETPVESISDASGNSPQKDSPPNPASPAKKTVDPEKRRKRIDKLLALCQDKLTEEVSALIGVEVKFTGVSNSLVSKEDLFFDELEGKQILADMDLVGDIEGKSYFFAGIRDSIRLGGILIMLPPSELESVINDEEFNEDLKDAYGEIANIASGVYTAIFEEQFTQKVRFIKKELQQVLPMKVDVESDDPIPDQQYYMSTMTFAADGDTFGNFRMVIPADLFGVAVADEPQAEAEQLEKVASQTTAANAPPAEVEPELQAKAPLREPGFDVEQHRKRVDKLLKECTKKTKEEVGALLGSEVGLEQLENRFISKEDFFFDEANGKQVFAQFDVVGELEDRSYLFVSLKDAIYMGGVLIMLPPSELEVVVSEEEFSEDTRDAYGEIANIISGVYTGVFEEQYVDKVRFVKKDIDQVVPMKVDIESDEPIPDIEYYMSSMSLTIEGQSMGQVNMLFPAQMLKLHSVEEGSEAGVEETAQGLEAFTQKTLAADDASPQRLASQQYSPVDILVVSDDETESAKLAVMAENRGFTTRQLSFKDDIKGSMTEGLKAVYIVMQAVNEQAFGMAIKVSSTSSLPVIAAGPDWTRSKVIKAVKYGVNDILLTPATPEDIQENLDNNLVKLAA